MFSRLVLGAIGASICWGLCVCVGGGGAEA